MTYVISFIVFLVVVVLMAIGVIFKRQAIQGSCGGLANIEIERECNCVETCDEHSRVLYQIQQPHAPSSLSITSARD
ncbi:(Na+)-NQR maturation NqrM [Vibrio salilacus]|uniref:(Na+)-NQR maturation NqrM n=1 Tax=Vibrio salilacus TaxID=1323749 RepID=UPI000C2AB8C6|nr:(Na+)-NQR maturation NqrM [Vibrio salilacus]